MDCLKNIEDGLTASGICFDKITEHQEPNLQAFIEVIQNLSKEAFNSVKGDRHICNGILEFLITSKITAAETKDNFAFYREIVSLKDAYAKRKDNYLFTHQGKNAHERVMDNLFGRIIFEEMPLDAFLNYPYLMTLAFIDTTLKSLTENNEKNTIEALISLITILELQRNHQSLSSNNSKAAKSKYSKPKEQLLLWYRENRKNFKTKAEAARKATEVTNLNERVIYRHISEYEKNINEFGESYYWNILRHL